MRMAVVTWNRLPENFASEGESLLFKISLSSKGSYHPLSSTQGTNWRFKELKLNTPYCVSVMAYNSSTSGPWSDCVNFTTPSVCLPGWISFGGHCYRTFNQRYSWKDANVDCLDNNSELASIQSDVENEFVKSLIETDSPCTWIGLRYHDEEPSWTDSSEVNFTKWSHDIAPPPYQDNDCVAFRGNEIWMKSSCSLDCKFICKRKDYEWPHQDCSNLPLGMENKAIPDTAFTYSEVRVSLNPAEFDTESPHLGSPGGWCPSSTDNVYFKVNLRAPHFICAIGIQGHSAADLYVTAYKIELAIKSSQGQYYEESGDIKIFQANNNSYAVKKNDLQTEVVAQHVSLIPTQWQGSPCFRMEIYGKVHIERVPTRAPENVTHSFSDVGLEVTWLPLPVYFHGYVLQGYTVAVYKDDILLGAWAQPIEPQSATLQGIKSENIDCVAVYGYTIYGNGVTSGCSVEEQGWTSWSSWSNCSKTCGIGGVTRRTRECIGNISCEGTNSDLKECVLPSCPGDGNQWSQWTEWSVCSKSCDQGEQFRNRTCLSEIQCEGSSEERQNCNSQECPVSGLDAPANMTVINITSSSFVLEWSPYTGDASLVGYHLLLLNQGRRDQRWTPQDGEFDNFTLDANVTVVEIENLYAFTKYCVQIGLIGEEGSGGLSNCFFVYTEGCQEALGMEDGNITDGQISASSQYSSHHSPNRSRLNIQASEAKKGAWSASTDDLNQWLQIDMVNQYTTVTRVATQGRNDYVQWVTKYALQFSDDGVDFQYYREQGQNTYKVFSGNTDQTTVIKHELNPPIKARYIRFRPVTWHERISMRVELYGCQGCQEALGMENGVILDAQINASSEFNARHAANLGRLYVLAGEGKTGAWSAGTLDVNQWLQIDLVNQHITVTRVATQGRNGYNQWVTSYKLQYRGNGENFKFYREQGQTEDKNFTGNTDRDTVVKHDLSPPIRARYIRFRPVTWHHHISMRVELYGCQESLGLLKPPTNLTAMDSTSSSFIISWSPYYGEATLLGYRVLVLNQGPRESRVKRAIAQLDGELIRNFTVAANVTSVEIGNLSAFAKYCVRLSLIAQERSGELSDCYYLYTEEISIKAPTILGAQKINSTSFSVSWDPVPSGGLSALIVGYRLSYYDANDHNSSLAITYTLTNSSQYAAILSGLQVYSNYCVQVRAFTNVEEGPASECFFLDVKNVLKDITAPKISASIRKTISTIEVKWDPQTFQGVKGEILGYELLYELVRVSGNPRDDSELRKVIICSTFDKYILTNLSSFTRYKFQMAAITANGIGQYSDPVYGETCACSKYITVASSSLNLQDAKTDDPNYDAIAAGLKKVISQLVVDSCGYCEEFGQTNLIYSNDSSLEELVFPVTKTSYGQSAYSKFIPVIRVPGVVVITRKKELGMILTEAASGSILQSWPIFALTIMMALLAGIIIWFLDSKTNPDHFPRQFIKGTGQGFWWSFISMTTVGYGDLCPKSIRAKAFAIVWFLVGLVIFSVFISAIASLLTVTTVKHTIGSSGGTDTKMVAVVADSPEQRVALGSLSGKLSIGSTFSDVEQLVDALKTERVDSILVDMYTPVKRKDLFNGSWFEVAKLLETEISHGVLLQGSAVKMADELSKMIVAKNVQTEYLQDGSEDQGYEDANNDEEPVTFFEPSSPYYRTTMYATLTALAVFLCCGVLYQISCYKRERTGPDNRIRQNSVSPESPEARDAMEIAVEEFYNSFSATYKELRRKCKNELILLAKLKQQGLKSSRFHNRAWESNV